MAHHTITENGNTVNCYEYAIATEDEYKVVLSAIDKLMDIDPPAGSIPGDILLWLSVSAQEFESKQMRENGGDRFLVPSDFPSQVCPGEDFRECGCPPNSGIERTPENLG